MKALRLEIEAIADKVYHWMKRHSARAAREDLAAGKPNGEAPGAAEGELKDELPLARAPGLLRHLRTR